MALDSTALDACLQKAIALLPPSHRLLPHDDEIFQFSEDAKTRVQDHAFTQGFAVVTENNDKKKHLVILDCIRHHIESKNTRKLDEKDRKRLNTKVTFNECKYRIRVKRNKDEVWRLILTNMEHNHEMAIDSFSFQKHNSRDPDRATALDHAKNLRDLSTKHG